MATNGFTPFSINAAPYSCWPVFVTPLNLPPGIIMKSEYIFLALVVPGLAGHFIEFVCAIHILYFDHNSSRELILLRGRMPIRVAVVNKWILVD